MSANNLPKGVPSDGSALVPPDHLGGGAYIAQDGDGVMLMANSYEYPTDSVYLDAYAVEAMLRYLGRIKGKEVSIQFQSNKAALLSSLEVKIRDAKTMREESSGAAVYPYYTGYIEACEQLLAEVQGPGPGVKYRKD